MQFLREEVCYALGNIAADGPACREALLVAGIVPAVHKMLAHMPVTASQRLVQGAAFLLSNLAKQDSCGQAILEAEMLPALFVHMHSPIPEVVSEIAYIFAYLTVPSDRIPFFINAGLVPIVVRKYAHF